MKHLSSKLILLTIALTTGLLTATAFFSFSILKKESRAYTFQSQLLQTQLFSATLETQLGQIRQIAADFVELQTTPETLDAKVKAFMDQMNRSHPELEGLGVKLLEGAPGWHSTPADAFASIAPNQVISKILLQPAQPGKPNTIALFPVKNAVLGIRMNLEKSFKNCAGLQSALINNEQKVVFHCNADQRALFEQASTVFQEIKNSRLNSGTLERTVGSQSYLWTYALLEGFGHVISVSTSNAAYGPAYSLVSQVLLLILMAVGIAVIASIWMARKVTGPIEEVTRATQKISAGDFDAKINIKTRDETSTLARSVEAMAGKIKTLLVSEIEKTKLDAQLEVAGAVQRTLIPPKKVDVGSYHISSYYHPADQCGGDWWGYIAGKRKVAVLIGDVSGHGYPSAFLVATTRGFLSMIEERVTVEGEILMGPADLLRSLNRVVFDATRAELNMTAICAIIDMDSGNFEISSAGHNPAYQICTDGSVQTLRSKGMRLGEVRELDTPFEVKSGCLARGDKLILFTDGVQDLGKLSETIGNKGFKNFIGAQNGASADEIVDHFEKELLPLNQGRPLADDVTFVVIEGNA